MGNEAKQTGRQATSERPARRKDLLDLNVLPQRHRRARLRWANAAPWLSLLGLIVLVYPTFQWFLTTNQMFNAVSGSLGQQRATQMALRTPSGTEAALSVQISEAKDQTNQLAAASAIVNLQQVAWGETLRFVLDNAPAGATILAVDQTDDSLVLTGDASTYQVPLAYAQRLQDSNRFLKVAVSVISRIGESGPTPVGSATATPGAPTEPSGFTFRLSIQTMSSNVSTPVPEATDAP